MNKFANNRIVIVVFLVLFTYLRIFIFSFSSDIELFAQPQGTISVDQPPLYPC